jgi:hypothetical protein
LEPLVAWLLQRQAAADLRQLKTCWSRRPEQVKPPVNATEQIVGTDLLDITSRRSYDEQSFMNSCS